MEDFAAGIRTQEQELQQRAAFALDRARSLGASDCEISIAASKGLEVSSRNCELETISYEHDRGMSVTVYSGRRRAHASTTDFSDEAITRTIEAALALTRHTGDDPCHGVLEERYLCRRFEDFDILHSVISDPEAAAERCRTLEQCALDQHAPGITRSDGASCSSTVYSHSYCCSNGFSATSSSTYSSMGLSLIGEHGGKMQTDSGFSAHCSPEHLYSTERIAREAIDNTVARLDVAPIPTGAYTVIFSRRAAMSVFSRLFQAISGSAVYRESSFLAGCLGQAVFPDFITVHEDPFEHQRLESSSYDNEGCARSACNLVEDGILREYLLSAYTARKLELEPNGHSGGLGSTYVRGRRQCSLPELLQDVGRGLVITAVMGPGVDIVSGNYSQGACGYYFEHGQRVHAVDEITIATNLRELFMGIRALADDYDERYKLKCPSFAVDNITVSSR